MQEKLKDLVEEISLEDQIDKELVNLGITMTEFGHGSGDLLPPLQLAQAFSNQFMVTCSQVIQILQALPSPVTESDGEQERIVGEGTGNLQQSNKEDIGGLAQRELQRLWTILRKHRSIQAQRERVGLVQILFAHIVNLKLCSSVMQVCPAIEQFPFSLLHYALFLNKSRTCELKS
jgi:hypothetical protein